MWYHFSLIGEPRQLIFPIGSKLDRFFLRLRGAPTVKMITQPQCETSSRTFLREALSRDGNDVVIDVFVNATYECAHID